MKRFKSPIDHLLEDEEIRRGIYTGVLNSITREFVGKKLTRSLVEKITSKITKHLNDPDLSPTESEIEDFISAVEGKRRNK